MRLVSSQRLLQLRERATFRFKSAWLTVFWLVFSSPQSLLLPHLDRCCFGEGYGHTFQDKIIHRIFVLAFVDSICVDQ